MAKNMVRLGEVASYINGYAFKPEDRGTEGLPIIRIQDLTGNSYDLGYYSGKYPKKIEINDGDILISWSASLGVYIWNNGKALLNQHIFKVEFVEDCIDKKYFVYAVRKKIDEMINKSHGATMKHIVKKDFEDTLIPYPTLEEQSKIAVELDRVSKIIDMRKRELELYDDLVKARFVEIFEAIKETCNVDYYIKELIAGKSLASEVECKNKVLKTGAASFDYFDESQVKNLPLNYEPKEEHLVHKGDIIISRMNTAELTGAAAYVWKVSDNVYIPDRLWKAVIRDGVNPIFLWNMLIQPSTKEQIQKVCSGTSGSMKNISKSGMLGIRVKKVDVYLQNEFATFVEQVNKSKVEVKKALDEAQLLFDSLMQKYFG